MKTQNKEKNIGDTCLRWKKDAMEKHINMIAQLQLCEDKMELISMSPMITFLTSLPPKIEIPTCITTQICSNQEYGRTFLTKK